MRQDFDGQWQELAGEVLSGMKEWRLQHAQARLGEIERAVDERLGKLRVRLLEDVAMASDAVEAGMSGEGKGIVCPHCGVRIEGRGQHERQLTSHYNQSVRLKRRYGVCPKCGAGFFPPG